MKRVVIGNDHGAVELVQRIKAHLEKRGYEVNWIGTKTTDPADYPDIASAACKEYLKGGYEFGMVCCGTGIGISIAANKIHGIRCALVHSTFTAALAKQHNHADFIAMGGRIDYPEPIEAIVDAFIDAEQSTEPRHQSRLAKLMALEKI